MKILHTADWHFGAQLGPYSRLSEQHLFVDQLCDIVDEHAVDMAIVAWDIFDVQNPSAAALALYFKAIAALGRRKIPIILVIGNHDSPERLLAPVPAVAGLGAAVFASPGCMPSAFSCENFTMRPLGAGVVEISFKKLGQTAVVAAMPFISEKSLNEAIFSANSEREMQKEYSAKIQELFAARAAYFRHDTVNIAAGHFHIAGGEASGGAERDIILGGSFAVHPTAIPAADYVAMGHLHRPQKLRTGPGRAHLAHYAGSPLAYSLSERGYPKGVYLADLAAGQAAHVEKIPLDCPMPIELWEVATAADAVEKCAAAGHGYKYIRIVEEVSLNPADIKEMRRLAPNIVSIDIGEAQAGLGAADYANVQILEPRAEFADFYTTIRGAAPKKEVMAVFDEILQGEDEI